MSQPQHPDAGHPEPAPEPGPPQPIPPPDPAPVPEPPHAAPGHAGLGHAGLERVAPERVAPEHGGAEPHTMELRAVPAEPQPFRAQPAEPLTAELHLPDLHAPPPAPASPAPDPYTAEPYTAEPYTPEPHGLDRPPPAWPLPVDPERTWHLPPPPTMHRGAHEANWPAAPGQRQWQPEPHHDGNWHPQHEQRPDIPGIVPGTEVHAGEPATPCAAPARPRRTALWVSLALALTLLLCGGGALSAFLLLRNADNGGAPDPATAVTRFLSAVYAAQDADAASDLVCREARDADKVAAKVDEVRGYSRQYDGPQFRWAQPTVSGQQDKQATVSVEVTMTTRDEKTSEQQLTFTVVKKTGWWVCEVAG